jgi:hypothetical protein
MLPEISLILPTRGRPSLARTMLDSVAETASQPDRVEVVLYVDRDDAPSHSIDQPLLRIERLIMPRANMGAMTRAAYAASHGRYVMLANDDLFFRTPGWDDAVIDAFHAVPDDVALVWGNDLFHGPSFPTHPVLSRTACTILGGICPARYQRDYIDAHLYDVFEQLRRLGHDRLRYLGEVVFEHVHVDCGKAGPAVAPVNRHASYDESTFISWAEERSSIARRLARHIAASGCVHARPSDLPSAERGKGLPAT